MLLCPVPLLGSTDVFCSPLQSRLRFHVFPCGYPMQVFNLAFVWGRLFSVEVDAQFCPTLQPVYPSVHNTLLFFFRTGCASASPSGIVSEETARIPLVCPLGGGPGMMAPKHWRQLSPEVSCTPIFRSCLLSCSLCFVFIALIMGSFCISKLQISPPWTEAMCEPGQFSENL